MNKNSKTYHKPNGEFLKFCFDCLPNLDRNYQDFKIVFTHSENKTCFGCRSGILVSKAFHFIKTHYFCTNCVLKGMCYCNKCVYPVIDVSIINNVVNTWNLSLTYFMKFKELYPSMNMNLQVFLQREMTDEEQRVEAEYIMVDPEDHHDKIAFFPNITYGDCSNLVCGSGNDSIYVKQTVMKLFFTLMERKSVHTPDETFVCLVNCGDLSIAMDSLFSKKKYGIFEYDKFVYTAMVDGNWITICVSKRSFLQYEILCYLPSEEWKVQCIQLAKMVETSMMTNFPSLKQKYEYLAMNDCVINSTYIEDNSSTGERDLRDSGIYAMFYAYQFILGFEIQIKPTDILQLRSLVLFMLVCMDYRYGIVKMQKDMDIL